MPRFLVLLHCLFSCIVAAGCTLDPRDSDPKSQLPPPPTYAAIGAVDGQNPTHCYETRNNSPFKMPCVQGQDTPPLTGEAEGERSLPGNVRRPFSTASGEAEGERSLPPSGQTLFLTASASDDRAGQTLSLSSASSRGPLHSGEVVTLAGGADHSLALSADGTVWAWGDNTYGQLGDGSTSSSESAVQVKRIGAVVAVAAGSDHSLAAARGGVWTWGDNTYGQLGDGTTTARSTPVWISGLQDAVAVSGGWRHSLALLADGTVRAWGDNTYGQLGDGSREARLTPVPVPGLEDIVAIAAGHTHSLALGSDGRIRSWGENGSGQLGDGTTTDRLSPILIDGLDGAVAIAAGYGHSLAVRTEDDGETSAWAWGWNEYGQLGDGTRTDHASPLRVNELSSVLEVAAGSCQSLALAVDGTVWTWGFNNSTGFEDEDGNDLVPVEVDGMPAAIFITEGDYHSLGLSADHQVWGWGGEAYGDAPIPVEGLP